MLLKSKKNKEDNSMEYQNDTKKAKQYHQQIKSNLLVSYSLEICLAKISSSHLYQNSSLNQELSGLKVNKKKKNDINKDNFFNFLQ